MNSPDLERLRFLLRSLREPAPSEESEQRALDAFGRLWAAGRRDWQTIGRERRSRPNRGSVTAGNELSWWRPTAALASTGAAATSERASSGPPTGYTPLGGP